MENIIKRYNRMVARVDFDKYDQKPSLPVVYQTGQVAPLQKSEANLKQFICQPSVLLPIFSVVGGQLTAQRSVFTQAQSIASLHQLVDLAGALIDDCTT